MKHRLVRKVLRTAESLLIHIHTAWCRFFLGKVGRGTIIRMHSRLDGDCLDKIIIGDDCSIDSFFVIGARTRLKENGKDIIPSIRIGNGCTIGQYNHITAVNRIEIGNNLLTGRFVLITDNSHGFQNEEMHLHPSMRQVESKGAVVIGDNVWLGDKVTVLPGVHIGNGSIIGANSVVTQDIPPYCVAAGVPAKVIKKIVG